MDFDTGEKDLAVTRELASLDAERCTTLSHAAQVKAKGYDWESVVQRFSQHYAQALAGQGRSP